MRYLSLVLFLVIVMLLLALGQTLDRALEAQLKRVFPAATAFSAKQTRPLPHFVAYTGSPDSPTIAGYVFWTTELEPLERGYDVPSRCWLAWIQLRT